MEKSSIKNSTNDRSESSASLRWLRWGERVSPALVARALVPMFLTPRRHARPASEQALLQNSQRSELRVGATRVPVYSWGEQGPLVLFSHGWEGRGTQVEPFLAPLLARGFRVVSWDQPGHGDAAAAQVSVVDFARVILALVAQRGPVHGAIGHSVGGTALAFARAEAPFAQRFATIASPLHPREFVAEFVAALGLSPVTARALETRFAARYGRVIEELDLRQVLPKIQAPALIVHDRQDREIPFAHGEQLASHWPGAQFLVTEGLGHRRILRDRAVVEAVVNAISLERTARAASLSQEIDRELFEPPLRLSAS